jgi:hypothetical protein
MAKTARARTASGSGGKSKPSRGDVHRQMVLFQWALDKLGVTDLANFRREYSIGPDSPEGIDGRTGLHRFHEQIAGVLPTLAAPRAVDLDALRRYEGNILEHTQAINGARTRHGEPTVQWKYHQYLALLFSEFYLDRYFDDPEGLRQELNQTIARHNADCDEADRVPEFPVDPAKDPADQADARWQLARLAYWCATGSGKTLLMHVHLRQFRHYHQHAHAAGRWPKLDQIILITPNDGLSTQHKLELERSGFDAVTPEEQGVDGLFGDHARRAIKILSIHKFKDDKPGPDAVVTEAFEGCNLVLVDEGHRGAGRGEGGKWLERRDQLSEGGFCFEYSATFKEAVDKDATMRGRYARSILFDYAYRSFYRDGYGKDFTILNLEPGEDQQARDLAVVQRRYLTAALLLFYQQLMVWADGGSAMRPFNIEKPLWVFVGHTVVGRSTEDDRETLSDVVTVLLFLHEFLADPVSAEALVGSLLKEGFRDASGRDLLANRLPHIDRQGDKSALARTIHAGILEHVFNAPSGGVLRAQELRAAEGELSLRVGEAEPFGVVNVGDPAAVAELCGRQGIAVEPPEQTGTSLFGRIGRDDSPINLLVGSRKFTEGWNSWRVSSLGLMRMGRGEGTQIIQLFGRGVRLRGFGMSLRRSSALGELPPLPPKPDNLRQVETLQVFGVRADYMATFREWVQSEVPEALDRHVWELPVVRTLPQPPARPMRRLRLREEIEGQRVERGSAFRRLGPLVILRPPDPTSSQDAWLLTNRVRLTWLPRVRALAGSDATIKATVGEEVELPRQSLTAVLPALDIAELVFHLERHKAAHGLERVHVDRERVRALLEVDNWYELHASGEDMRPDRWENRRQWQRMAEQLLSKFCDKRYTHARGLWEAPYLEVVEVDERDDNLPEHYIVEAIDDGSGTQNLAALQRQVEDLLAQIKHAKQTRRGFHWQYASGRWKVVPFDGHLYLPLLHVGKGVAIRVSPVALNESETTFVEALAAWCDEHPDVEVRLLRNRADVGLGFFQAANWRPDFFLWVRHDGVEHLAFVDPHGLVHTGAADPKVLFATQEIPKLQAIIDRQRAAVGLRLHAWIVSPTRYEDLTWATGGVRMSKADVEALHVAFQTNDPGSYVDTIMREIL